MAFLKAIWISAALLLVFAHVWAKKKSLTAKELSKVNAYFKKADEDGNGGLTKQEMIKAGKHKGPKRAEHLKVCTGLHF